MNPALVIAAGSFFTGQQQLLSQAVQGSPVLALPMLAVWIALVVWMLRLKARPSRLAFATGLGAVVIGATLPATPASAGTYRPPRTAFGAPDLQGLWTNSSLTMLQRPPIFKGLIATEPEAKMMEAGFKMMAGDLLKPTVDPNAPPPPVVKEAPQADYIEMDLHLAKIGGQMRSSWIVEPTNGRIPFTDKGRQARRAAVKDDFDGPERRPLTERCLTAIGSPEGPPMMNTGFNAHYQIVQTRNLVAINIEMNHDVRLVRLGNRIHPPANVQLWMGDSVGWWEGDTLVVETTNLRPGAGVDSLGGGFTYGVRTKVIERLTRTATDQLLYTFTVEDPDYLKQNFVGEMPMRKAKGPIFEYACHEGNYSLPNALAGARADERLAKSRGRIDRPIEA